VRSVETKPPLIGVTVSAPKAAPSPAVSDAFVDKVTADSKLLMESMVTVLGALLPAMTRGELEYTDNEKPGSGIVRKM